MTTQQKLDLAESRYKALLKSMSSPESKVGTFNHNQINKAFAEVIKLKKEGFAKLTVQQKLKTWMEL